MKATVFLGGGRITGALVAGLRLAGYDRPTVVHDRHAEKLQQLKRQYGIAVEPDLHRAVESAHLLIIAVRPDSVRGLLKEVGTHKIRQQLTAVSLAAGVPLSKLRAGLRSPVQWVRAMPSPVCRTGRGLTALTFGRDTPGTARAKVRELFALVGGVLEIPENQFDAFTVTFSSSHGYHALATLLDAGRGHRTRPQERACGRRSRASRRDCGLARRLFSLGGLATGGGHARRHCSSGDRINQRCRIRKDNRTGFACRN